LVVIKPDGVQRSLIGEVIKRYERTGLKLVGLKMLVPEEEFVRKHYLLDSEWPMKNGTKSIEAYRKQGKKPPSEDPLEMNKLTLAKLIKYLSSGPVVAMVWEGIHAAGIVRKITGGTEPLTSDVGTIRGDYTIDSYEIADIDGRSTRNVVHASGSAKEAEMEIPLWFGPTELLRYGLVSDRILYDVNLDGILE
jgi:nucleoside-diphosphate kinase